MFLEKSNLRMSYLAYFLVSPFLCRACMKERRETRVLFVAREKKVIVLWRYKRGEASKTDEGIFIPEYHGSTFIFIALLQISL